MKRFLFVLSLCLLGAGLCLTTPAQAVNIPGCGEFTLYAKDRIAFEPGSTIINGNVLVSAPDGIVKVGSHNEINGRVTAHEITLGTGAVVAECQADIISGSGTCTVVVPGGFAGVTPACLVYPLTDPVVVPACVDTAAAVTVPASPPATALGPGCYGALRVLDGGILNLAGGPYNFKTIRIGSGSAVTGQATINVKGLFVTENAVALTNLIINSAQSTGEAHIGNSSILTNVVFNAPATRIHIHTGASLRGGSELVAEQIAVEPITTDLPPPPGLICECPDGFEFVQGFPGNPDLNRKCCKTGDAGCPNP